MSSWTSPQWPLRMALYRLLVCWDWFLQTVSRGSFMCEVRCTVQTGYPGDSLGIYGVACAIIWHWASGGGQYLNVRLDCTIFLSGYRMGYSLSVATVKSTGANVCTKSTGANVLTTCALWTVLPSRKGFSWVWAGKALLHRVLLGYPSYEDKKKSDEPTYVFKNVLLFCRYCLRMTRHSWINFTVWVMITSSSMFLRCVCVCCFVLFHWYWGIVMVPGFHHENPRGTHPRLKIARQPSSPCHPQDNLGCPDPYTPP